MNEQFNKYQVPDLPDWLQKALLSPIDLFQIYRLLLVIFLLSSYLTDSGPAWLGLYSADLFETSAFVYLGFIIASLILDHLRNIEQSLLVQFVILSDLVFITLIMHSSGGLQSGMGLLLAISVTAGSLLMRGRMALLFASLASFAVISEQFVIYLLIAKIPPGLVQGAFLGIAFFSIALLSHSLGLHIRRSEAIADEAQSALDNLSRINQQVVEQMQSGLMAVSAENRIITINQQAKDLLNCNSEKNLMQISSLLTIATDKFRDSADHQHKTQIKLPHASLAIQFKRLPEKDSQDILIFIDNPTEIRNKANQLKLASLGRLTASIAHEIRNPLSAINYASQLLEENPDANKTQQKRLTEIINSNTARLNKIIDNVLELSRRQKPAIKPVQIADFFQELINNCLTNCQLKTSQISFHKVSDNASIQFDSTQIEQACIILLSNAVKHFDRNIKELSIELSMQQDEKSRQLMICDNGPGIKAEHLQHIFEPFFTTTHRGTGLGLYIAKELVEANQGELRYTTAMPHGSIFTMIFQSNPNDLNENESI